MRIIKSGISFCHVKNVNPRTIVILQIIAPPQKCNGANLAFNNSPNSNPNPKITLQSYNKPPNNNASDPTLCTMKYNIQFFFILLLVPSNGRKDIRLVSNIIHTAGHDSDETAPKTLKNTPVHIKLVNPILHNITHRPTPRKEQSVEEL